jgi:hypothetical protein
MTNGTISISPSSTSLTYVVISQPHLRMVCTYRSLFVMQELARHTISFYFEAVYWQTITCHKGFKFLAYMHLSANVIVVTTILFTHTTFLVATCCLTRFIAIVKPFLILVFTTVHTVYLIWKKGSRRVWSIDRGYSLLHGTWSHLWYIQRSVYAHSLIYISYRTYEIEYCSIFLSFPTCSVQVLWGFQRFYSVLSKLKLLWKKNQNPFEH